LNDLQSNKAPVVNPTLMGSVSLPETTEYAGEQLSDRFAAKLPYSYGTATPTTSDDGFLWYDENDTPPTPKFWDGAAFQALTSGKILQIVRATDSTNRSTTSTSFVDITGMSVSITPSKSDSAVVIVCTVVCALSRTSGDAVGEFRITDSSNNPISGGEAALVRVNASSSVNNSLTIIAYATPATTASVTYKLRFLANSGTTNTALNFNGSTGQIYAIEVSA